jgi:hypothetical protein
LIRQAISCDICASEKRQTNHWFVAHEQGEELRITGWNSRNRLRPGSKHLCGQTCLHKLVDEFMARALAARGASAADEAPVDRAVAADSSLTSDLSYEKPSSLSRPQQPIAAAPRPIPARLPPELVPIPHKPQGGDETGIPDDSPRYASRNWRAEAWEREREREMHAVERSSDIAPRRRSSY